MNSKIVYLIGFVFITLVNLTFSKVFWFLPFQILFTDFYNKYMLYNHSNNILFFTLLSLLLVGSLKITYWEFKAKKQYNFLTKIILIPVVIFMKLK